MTVSSVFRRCLPAVVAWACLATPAAAQQVLFEPSLIVTGGFNSNVSFVATEDSEFDDLKGTVALDLPVVRRWRTGEASFRYRPGYTAYADAEGLDHDEHLVTAALDSELSRQSRISFGASFLDTQAQARSPQLVTTPIPDDTDPFLSNRTDRRSLDAQVDFDRRLGQRWSLGLGAGWSERDHETLDDVDLGDEAPLPPDDEQYIVEDRQEVHGSISLERIFSRQTSAGLRYQRRDYDLELTMQDESVDVLSFTWQRQVSRRLDVGFAVGGFRGAGSAADPDDEERSGLQGEVDLTRRYRRTTLAVRAEHRPSSGDHLRGTSTYSELQMILAKRPGGVWDWQLSPRVAHRDPTQDEFVTQTAITLSGSAERAFGDAMGLRLGAGLVAQKDENGSFGDRQVASVDAGLVWYLRGRRLPREDPGAAVEGAGPQETTR